jgi:hypothetical protein
MPLGIDISLMDCLQPVIQLACEASEIDGRVSILLHNVLLGLDQFVVHPVFLGNHDQTFRNVCHEKVNFP